jgi:predicted neutral ceramidase superfamily lipid hydrolase
MRTAIIMAVGFVLWAACLGVAKLLARSSTSSMITATVAFVVIWFVAAAANMWIGVSHAGYSFREELPIFLLIFLLPCAVAMFVKWKFL